MPDLMPEEDNNYIALNDHEVGQIPRAVSRKDDWILALWGSGNTLFMPCNIFFSFFVFVCLLLTCELSLAVSTLQDVIRCRQQKEQALKLWSEAGGVEVLVMDNAEVSGTGHGTEVSD